MPVELREQDVRTMYRLLQHNGYKTQVHAQNRQTNKIEDRRTLDSVDLLIAWTRKFNGRADLFIGRNPRAEDGQVAAITGLSIDIDPIRPKGTASNAAQLQRALQAGRDILRCPEYQGGHLSSSGNGCHAYWGFPVPLTTGLEDFERKARSFEDEIRTKISHTYRSELNVDSIFDNPRLVKIVGTTATKGQPSEWRCARYISPINWGSAFSGSVFERIQSCAITEPMGDTSTVFTTEGMDRSKFDWDFAVQLKQKGYGPKDIYAALCTRGLKAGERPDDAKRIVEKIFKDSTTNTNQPRSGEGYQEPKPIEIYSPGTNFAEYEAQYISVRDKPCAELPTGLSVLDGHTNGLKKGSIWVVGARTGIGKTSFSITVANHLIGLDKRVLFFSTEMAWGDILNRFIAMGAGLPLFDLERGTLSSEHRRSYLDYKESIKSKPLFICDKPEPTLGEVSEIVSRVRPDVFIFDHIQRVTHSNDQRYLELSRFVKGINTICRDTGAAGIINSQLNRLAESEPPALHHLKECGALEEEAHAVILLSRLSKNEADSEQFVLADLAKNRGPKGPIELKFIKSTTKFIGVV